ncbi:MAG: hypothetical protein E7I44_05695, partial [Enterococcus hirae]|nr:hypothetical protein [Enterococcus hirae]
MTTDTIKITMDLLYRKYLIPMLLFDENGYLIHPKNLEDLPITISTYFPFRKTEQIQLYHTTSYLYGYFCFKSDQKEYQMIIGPCGIIGSKETSWNGNSFFDKFYKVQNFFPYAIPIVLDNEPPRM